MITKKCLKCGKEFNTIPAKIKEGKGKYCSKKCFVISYSTSFYKNCEKCNKEFKTTPKRMKIGRGRFCSRRCARLGHNLTKKQKLFLSNYWKNKKQGKENPNWKGGTTALNKLERMKFSKRIKIMVFERDNYTCQICGSHDNLQVDHIQRWSEYIEGRFNILNCRTLCVKCHYFITFNKPIPNILKVGLVV